MLIELAAPTVFPVSLATAKEWLRETTPDSDAVIQRLIKAAVARVEKVTHLALVSRPVREKFDGFGPCLELNGFPVRGVRSITYLDANGAQQTLPAANYIVDTTEPATRITPAFSMYFPPTRPVMKAVQIDYDMGLLCSVTAVNLGTGTLTIPGHNKVAGDIAQITTDGGTIPTGITAGQALYVVNPVGDNLQLSLTAGGAAIVPLTGAFLAPCFLGLLPDDILAAMELMMDTWHRNRSDVSPQQVWEMPGNGAAENLLAPYIVRGFQ